MRNRRLVMPLCMAITTLASGICSAQAAELADIVKISRSTCLSGVVQVVRPGLRSYSNGLKLRVRPNTTVDLRGITIRAQGSPSDARSITTVTAFNNVCVVGGHHLGKQDPQQVPWVVGHGIYGAGIIFSNGSGSVTLENAVIENSLQDGIILNGSLAGNVVFGMRGIYIKNNSDDAIQNDAGKRITFIEDSLIESKMGISLRPGRDARDDAGNYGNYRIPIRNTLVNIICVADDRPDGSDQRNASEARRNNCGPSRSASMPFKWSGAASGVGVEMSDSIVRFEARSRNGWRSMSWLPGTYRNVILVWDPVKAGMKYEGPALPKGVTLTTDASVWTRAKATWLRVHGCTAAGGCTFPASSRPAARQGS